MKLEFAMQCRPSPSEKDKRMRPDDQRTEPERSVARDDDSSNGAGNKNIF